MNDDKNKTIKFLMTTLVILLILLVGGNVYEHLFNKKPSREQVDNKIEISNLQYVEFEDIKTKDSTIKKDGKNKYSQIKVKNISNDTIYGLSINLYEQETNEDNVYVLPSYNLEILKPGDVAVLSTVHEDIKEGEQFLVSDYEYFDKTGDYFNSIVNNSKKAVKDNNFKREFKNATSDVKIIKVNYMKTIKENGKEYLELELVNTSNHHLKDVYLNFGEYYNNTVVGSISEDVGKLSPNQSKIIKVEHKDGVSLELEGYNYIITNHGSSKNDNDEKMYNRVFIEENIYDSFDIEKMQNEQKLNKIILFLNIIIILATNLISVIGDRLKKKGEAEDNEKYIKKSKLLMILKNIFLVVYILIILFIIFID